MWEECTLSPRGTFWLSFGASAFGLPARVRVAHGKNRWNSFVWDQVAFDSVAKDRVDGQIEIKSGDSTCHIRHGAQPENSLIVPEYFFFFFYFTKSAGTISQIRRRHPKQPVSCTAVLFFPSDFVGTNDGTTGKTCT